MCSPQRLRLKSTTCICSWRSFGQGMESRLVTQNRRRLRSASRDGFESLRPDRRWNSPARVRMLPQIRADERAHRHDSQTFGARAFQRAFDERLSEPASPKRFRDLGVQKTDGIRPSFIRHERDLTLNRKLEATLRAVVGDHQK